MDFFLCMHVNVCAYVCTCVCIENSRTYAHKPARTGYTDLPSRMATQSSALYANNIAKYLLSMGPKGESLSVSAFRSAPPPFPPSLSSLRSRLCLSVYVCVSRIVCAVCACVSSYLICKSSMHMQSRARQSPPTHAHAGQFLIDDEDYAVRGALVLRQGALSWPAPAPPPSPASAAPAAPAKKEPPTPKEIAAAAAAATRRQVRVRRRCRACARRRPCVRLCGWVCLTRATKP